MSERRFTSGQSVQFEETRWCEFKEIKGSNPVDSIKNTSDEYVVAFLNREGGGIYWGIRNIDRVVVGVRLNDEERDQNRRIVTDNLAAIQPAIAPSTFQINLHPIYGDKKDVVINAYVIEIIVPAGAREHRY